MHEAEETQAPERGADVYRHKLPTRIWHWVNAVTLFIMLMSGLGILNAHPRLYWGHAGAQERDAWLVIGDVVTAIPGWLTIPSVYDLAASRTWHFAFAWVLAVGLLLFMLTSLFNRHIKRDLHVRRGQWSPRHIWSDIKDHARLRLPKGETARNYGILQKLSYIGVIFILLPLMIFTGLAMSPGMDAAWPWLIDIFGGRQSARSIHFICAGLLVAFFVVHIIMVALAGPLNELRSMITGWYRLPKDRP